MSYSIPKIDGGFYVYSSTSINTLKDALRAAAIAGDVLSGCNLTGTPTNYLDIRDINLLNLKIPASRLSYCDFTNSVLTNSDLSYCFGSPYLTCKFIGSTLINSNLNYITFYGPYADFSNANLTNAKLGNALFYSTIFSETNLTNVIFSDVSVSGIPTFNICNLSNTNFSNKKLIGFYFNNCNLYRANFSNCDSRNLTEIIYPHPFDIFSNCDLTNVNFSNANLTEQILTNNVLTYCNFTDAILYQCNLSNILSGSNCNFTRTDLQFSILTNSNFNNSYFKECDFSDVTLNKTILSGCNLQYSNWNEVGDNKYLNLQEADLTNAFLFNTDISTFNLTDANLTRVILSACIFSSSSREELDKAEYDLSVATEKLEADIITLQTISATIANPLQAEINASIAEENARTNYETSLSELSDIIVQLKVDYTPRPNSFEKEYDHYTTKEIDDKCKELDTYASQNTDWDIIKIKRTFAVKPGPTEAEGQDWSGRGGYGANWYVLTYPEDIFESYYILSLQTYNNVNGLKKIYEDAIKDHDLKVTELKPYTGSYNNALEDVNADTLLVNEYQELVNQYQAETIELSASPLITTYTNLDGANLTESNLTGRDLTLCSLKGTIFKDTILTNVNFTSATLYDDDLSGIILKGCIFHYANLSGTNFSNIIDMTGLDFSFSDLRESNFTNSNFNGSIFDYANMTGATVKAIDSFSGTPTSGFSTLTNVSFNNAILNDVVLTKVDFTGNTNLKRVSLTGSDLTGSKLNYVDMSEAILSNAVFNSVIATNAIFTSANMVRIDLSQSVLTNSIFTSANMQRAFLQNAEASFCDFQYALMFSDDMRYSNFTHSKFNYANMVSCDLRNSNWSSNNFSYADMSKVKANKADFLYPILTGTKLSFLETQKVNLLKAS